MSKIVIVGAGVGGLAFAYKYTGSAEIVLFEKKSREDLGFPWHDSVKAEVFDELGIPLPKKGVCGKKLFDMFSPSCRGYVPQRQKTVSGGYEIDRIELIKHLLSLAEDKADMHFSTAVHGLILNEGNVIGVKTDDGDFLADMVIDASGAFSSLRREICPNEEDREPNPDEILYCMRAMFKIDDGAYVPPKDAVYVKHLGGTALSWLRTAPESNNMDVFVSSIGTPLSAEYIERAENDMRERNSAFSKNVVYRRYERLALRYPLSTMVYNSFAFVGDSAYTANPVNGCGIENALRGGALLADTLNNAKGFSINDLWEYQVKFMRQVGSTLIALDIFKRWVFDVSPEDIDWLFDTMIGEEIIEYLTTTEKKSFNPKIFLNKIPVAFDRKDILSEGLAVVSKAAQAKAFALMIPVKYDKKLVTSWEKRYNDYIRKRKKDKKVK